MPILRVKDDTSRRLLDRARQENCSVDDLLNRLLDAPSSAPELPYQDILSQSSDLIAVLDLEQRYVYVNKHIEAVTGLLPSEMIGKTNSELGISDDRVSFWDASVRQVIATRHEQVITFDYAAKDGQRVYETRLTPILNASGDVQQLLGITRDITERQRIEVQLRRSEANLRAMLNGAWQSFTLLDREHRVIDLDERSKKTTEILFGKRMEPGDSMYDFMPEGDLEGFNRNFASALAGKRVTVEKCFTGQQGSDFYFEVTYYPVVDSTGETIGVCMSAQNITDRKQSEQALSQSQEAYRLLADNITDMISRHTPEGVYTYATPSAQALLGYAPEALVGRSIYEFPYRDDMEAVQRAHQAILEHSWSQRVEYRARHQAGFYMWVETISRLVRDTATGAPVEIIAMTRDITERKRAEAVQRRDAMRLRSLLETQSALVVRCDLEGRYTYVNRSFADKYRWLGDNLIGRLVLDMVQPGDQDKAVAAAMACLAEPGKPVQVVLRKTVPDDSLLWTMWEFVAIRDSEGAPIEIQCMGFDITRQMQIEEALRQSEERYRIISELVSDYAYAYRVEADDQITLEWITDVYFQITGYSIGDPEALIPFQIYHPDDRERVRQDVARVIQGAEVAAEYRIVTKNGDLRWVRAYRRPVWDEHMQRPIRFYGVFQDITAEKQAEQARLEQERLKATLKKEQQFNSVVQKAVSALAHDARTPLTVIATAKDLLEHYYDRLDETKRREKFDSIGKQLNYMVDLLDEVVMTVRGTLDTSLFKPELVNLPALCQASLDEIQEASGNYHDLQFITDEQITTAFVDETLICRIVLNLLSNATKFSPPESEIRLELNRDQDWIVLRVVDQGIGIAEIDQPHIFEPFYRTNATRHIWGTGLGLNIVRDSVERHRGRIEVASRVGQGTTFTVRLPLIID